MQEQRRFIDRFSTSGDKYKRIDWLLKNDFSAVKDMNTYELIFSIQSDDVIADVEGENGALKDLESSLDFLKEEIELSEAQSDLKKLRDKVRKQHKRLLTLLDQRWKIIDEGGEDSSVETKPKTVNRINLSNKFDAKLFNYVKQNSDVDINKLFHVFRRLYGVTFEALELQSKANTPELKVSDALEQLFLQSYEVAEFQLSEENSDKDYVCLTSLNEHGEIGKLKKFTRGTLRRKIAEIKKILKSN